MSLLALKLLISFKFISRTNANGYKDFWSQSLTQLYFYDLRIKEVCFQWYCIYFIFQCNQKVTELTEALGYSEKFFTVQKLWEIDYLLGLFNPIFDMRRRVIVSWHCKINPANLINLIAGCTLNKTEP